MLILKNEQEEILRSSQMLYGSPTYPTRQTQTARWLLALQSAFIPHFAVKQGSWHFSWIHARWIGHSGSEVHSGLGAGNLEINYVNHAFTMQVAQQHIKPM